MDHATVAAALLATPFAAVLLPLTLRLLPVISRIRQLIINFRAADPRLSATDVRVYAAVLYFLRDWPSCRPTNADLGRRACRSIATVKRSLAALEAVGVIERVPDDNPTGRRLVVRRRATPPAHHRAASSSWASRPPAHG